MTSLQLGLIAAGVALVVGVIAYNWMQERRVRRRIGEAFSAGEARPETAPEAPRAETAGGRVEPTLAASRAAQALPENGPPAAGEPPVDEYEAPVAIKGRIATDLSDTGYAAVTAPLGEGPSPTGGARAPAADRNSPQPDPDIECVVVLQPVRPVEAGALAAGLHARLGRPLRWLGRRGRDLPWQILRSDSVGDFSEVAACLLLANRAGAASRPMLDTFVRVVGELAPTLPAAFVAPDTEAEAARAEALDRICADLDVQIGITLLKTDAATIAGTRLRGIAEAAGFRLAEGGRFDWIVEETGAVLYSLQNYRAEPFTAETLRVTSTPGAVFLLDVPRVADPVRVFDQMKLAAKRMAQTLDAALVDDNRRALDDAAFAAIREQVRSTVAALREVNIEPGSARALALFGG
jgi:hypothetical protein